MKTLKTNQRKHKFIDLSVVSHNSGKWVKDFFSSLRNQSFPTTQIHLLINDCASTDDTVALIQQEIDKTPFASVQLGSSENIGFGAGHNINIGHGTSDFILVANMDLEFEVDSITNVVQRALGDESDIASWEFRQKPHEHPKLYDPFDLTTSWSSSACILFRKEALCVVGGYDDAIFMYCEDVDLSWRLRSAGYRLRYVPDAVCWHHTYQESKFKEGQFIGSLVGNLMLRMRFGSDDDRRKGDALFNIVLHDIKSSKPSVKETLEKAYASLLQRQEHFSHQTLPYRASGVAKFLDWDYEETRQGAFYESKAMPEASMKVAIIIRTYRGRWRLLQEALASALNQTYKNVEILVVEDGGHTLAKAVEKFSDRQIQYFGLPKVGRCETANFAMSASNADFFCLLDDDDFLYADHVETILSEILAQGNALAGYAAALEIRTNLEKAPSGNIIGYKEILPYKRFYHAFEFRKLLIQNLTPIQGVLFHRDLFTRHGGLASELENLEDWDLWVRYSQSTRFISIDKTTSGFRTPADTKINKARQSLLDHYYATAVKRMADYKLSFDSFGELHKIIKESISEGAALVTNSSSIVIHPNDPNFHGSIEHYVSCGKQLATLIDIYVDIFASLSIGQLDPGYGRVSRFVSPRNRSRLTCITNHPEQASFINKVLEIATLDVKKVKAMSSNAYFDMVITTIMVSDDKDALIRSLSPIFANLSSNGSLIFAHPTSSQFESRLIYAQVAENFQRRLVAVHEKFWDGAVNVVVIN